MPFKHIFPGEICHFGHLARYSISATILLWIGPVKERSVIDTTKQQNDGKIESIQAKEVATGKSVDTIHQAKEEQKC